MRHTIIACCLLALSSASPAAGDYDEFEYQFTLSLERSALEGVTLGDDPQGDRLVIEEYELELDLEYALGDDAYLFFVGTLVDDSETLETAGNEEESRGLEVSQLLGHTNYIIQIAWSPDGERLFSASGDGDVRIWRTDPLEELLTALRNDYQAALLEKEAQPD